MAEGFDQIREALKGAEAHVPEDSNVYKKDRSGRSHRKDVRTARRTTRILKGHTDVPGGSRERSETEGEENSIPEAVRTVSEPQGQQEGPLELSDAQIAALKERGYTSNFEFLPIDVQKKVVAELNTTPAEPPASAPAEVEPPAPVKEESVLPDSRELDPRLKELGYSENFFYLQPERQKKIIAELDTTPVEQEVEPQTPEPVPTSEPEPQVRTRQQELRDRLQQIELELRKPHMKITDRRSSAPLAGPSAVEMLEKEGSELEKELRRFTQKPEAAVAVEPKAEEIVSVAEPAPVEEPPSTDGIEVGEDVEEVVLASSDAPESGDTFVGTSVVEAGKPEEVREKLRDLVGKFETPVATVPEKSAAEQVQEYFVGRSSYQAEKAKGLNIERGLRWLGEKYNKLPFKAKLAVGAALGVGAGVVSAGVLPISFTAAYWCLGGVAAQRVAGFAGAFLKFEGNRMKSEEESNKFWKWGAKEKAMGKAMLYTAGMTGAMYLLSAGVREGVTYAQEHHLIDRATDWLGNILGHHRAPAPEGGVLKSSFPHSPIQEGMGERLAPEMPSISAEHGHGYEYMLKRLAEELQAKHLDPSNYPENSDIHKLLTADSSNIDQVIHRIAASVKEGHGFFKTDGTNVIVNPGAHMTIDVSGEVHIVNPLDTVHAPEGAHTTPVYPHAQVEAPAPAAEPVTPNVAPAPAVEAVPSHPAGGEPVPATHSPEVPVAPPVEHHVWYMNKHNVPIYKGEAHLYGDASGKHVFLYSEGGGMGNQQKHDLLKEFFLSHPKGPHTVYQIDHATSGGDKIVRVPWFLDPKTMEPKSLLSEPINKFLGLFSPWRHFSGPDDFRTFIK